MIPKWNKAVEIDNNLKVPLESFCVNRDSLEIEDGYSPLFLSAVYHSKKLGVFPKGYFFSCCGFNFSTKHVEESLEDIDTKTWDNPHMLVPHLPILSTKGLQLALCVCSLLYWWMTKLIQKLCSLQGHFIKFGCCLRGTQSGHHRIPHRPTKRANAFSIQTRSWLM
jgi:hypothetical protein